jgi:hypothetical protein
MRKKLKSIHFIHTVELRIKINYYYYYYYYYYA